MPGRRVVAGLLMPGDVLPGGAVVSAVAGRASGGPLTVVCRLRDGAEEVRVFADRFEVLVVGAGG